MGTPDRVISAVSAASELPSPVKRAIVAAVGEMPADTPIQLESSGRIDIREGSCTIIVTMKATLPQADVRRLMPNALPPPLP